MGAGSVAMFQVGETTQQVSVGSEVGQSGWQVKEVREQEVVLARGGQNRTLIVGQAVTD
jgi:Tfp pilus assembly protein PilP